MWGQRQLAPTLLPPKYRFPYTDKIYYPIFIRSSMNQAHLMSSKQHSRTKYGTLDHFKSKEGIMNLDNKHVGSSLDEFLAEEGLLESSQSVAIKRVLSWQLTQFMQKQNLSKAAMAARMNTSRSALDRLLDPDNESVTLNTLQNAARAIGAHLEMKLVFEDRAA